MSMPARFYRYEDMAFADGPHIIEHVFYLVKETSHGWWIHSSPNYKKSDLEFYGQGYKPKWVGKAARKRFAYPTREEAMASFRARKLRQLSKLWSQMARARKALELIGEGDSLRSLEARLAVPRSSYLLRMRDY